MKEQHSTLEPRRPREVTLGDLLDKLLEKGLVLHADLVITVAGIPLLGANLRLLLAGMSTMLRYGVMCDWDEAQRAAAARQKRQEGPPLAQEEKVFFSVFGSWWYSRGIYSAWRPGFIHLTDRRLLVYRREPEEVLLEVPYGKISTMEIEEVEHYGGKREELLLKLSSGEVVRLHVQPPGLLVAHLQEMLRSFSIARVILNRMVWYFVPYQRKSIWKPGKFSLLQGRLCWCNLEDNRPLFVVDPADVREVALLEGKSGPEGLPVLKMDYLGRIHPQEAYFSADRDTLQKWLCLLGEAKGTFLETCPACGVPAPARNLLKDGCVSCGWVSTRKKK